ncbi:hypothetical protein EMIHUDRAFT_219642 [Emiliania huxleyi CCMP1516]|uniref:Uncharacterized protein n=2 Tax=Emiliania huxleyi TaxID=2903 RepID=A0A0D3I3V0_EMIH1|nr:hypothetical protein EMIHUDRAFT_219642 [Emiliania huxleyi CCMP1516]EOD05935.1 hypothetical protein EMIHUDRAFT_219642 [Emiliania huxleyi CCMP1516]|eukprot:XP_005758364.1 hypothetical protein EMIHUDRAFT_219642 [Emiliania huxleyi CCMP1516]
MNHTSRKERQSRPKIFDKFDAWAFKRHFARVGAAERCTESIFTDHQRQVCDYALVYAEKKNDGDAPYSVSFTATQSGDVIVQLHPHSQLERAVRHERQAQATEPPASASPAAPPAPAAEPPAAEPATSMTKRGQQQRGKGRSASGRANAGPRLVDKNALSARGGGPSRQSRSPSPDSPPAKRASSADSSGYDTDLPDEVQQEAVRRVCGALGLKEQYDAAVAAGELLELLESLPRGTVEASIRLMRGYTRTGEWPEPILPSPAPERGRSPRSPSDEWSDE